MSREKILSCVREALAISTDTHVRQSSRQTSTSLPVLANGPDSMANPVREFLPHVGKSFAEHVTAFRELSEKLQTEFINVANVESAANELNRLAAENGWKQIGIHDNDLVQSVTDDLDCLDDEKHPIEFINTSTSYNVHDLERCDVGISGCDALIAQTASVLVTAKSAGGRALSVLPPHHVVIATSDQMLTTMADGYALLAEKHDGNWPSFISFITGPSRTADIERVLVLGAHGPKKLTVIMIENR